MLSPLPMLSPPRAGDLARLTALTRHLRQLAQVDLREVERWQQCFLKVLQIPEFGNFLPNHDLRNIEFGSKPYKNLPNSQNYRIR